MSSFSLYTVASDWSKVDKLRKTAALKDVIVKVYFLQEWKGFTDKITAMKKLLQHLMEDAIVCFVDAYDVLVYGGEEEILRKFDRYDCDILFGAEVNCYPEENRSAYSKISGIQGQATTNYQYLNSGCYIGRVKALRDMLSWKTEQEIETISDLGGDQNYFTQFYLAHARDRTVQDGGRLLWKIRLDTHQSLFQNMCKVNIPEFAMVDGRLYNTVLAELPCIVHLNGYKDFHDCLLNTETNTQEPVMDIFTNTARVSREARSFFNLPYRHPFWITIDGITQENIPQLPLT